VDVPDTRYATSADGVNIAYQAFGTGPTTVLIPPLVSNVEMVWEHEYHRRVLEYESQHLHFIQFDKRGIGVSDRWDEPPTLDQRIMDIAAVMDAEGVERAHLIGLSEGGLMAQRFALAHPERVDRLMLVNTYGTIDPKEIEPYGPPFDIPWVLQQFERLVASWGTDPSFLVGWMMPSHAADEEFTRFTGRYQRQSASPAAIRQQVDSVLSLLAPRELDTITAPTMVMHCAGDLVVPVACGRHLAATIPGARYVEVDMPDHFLWINDGWREFVDIALPFLHERDEPIVVERSFGALLFSDVVGSTAAAAETGDDRWRDLLASHDRVTSAAVAAGRGRVVKRMGDGLVAMFPTASAAVDAAMRVRADVTRIGLTVRVGVHAGEFEVLDDGDIRGIGVHVAARIEALAEAGEVLVSSTVRDLMLGSGRTFVDRGRRSLKGIEGDWQLYAIG
jgi:pimeloyl-ACP methyl ester carboxylesterase/class 3 adenylate cyclase